MAVLPTVEIVCPKDGVSLWRINQADYDPATHVLWAERPQPAAAPDPEEPEEPEAPPKPPSAPAKKAAKST